MKWSNIGWAHRNFKSVCKCCNYRKLSEEEHRAIIIGLSLVTCSPKNLYITVNVSKDMYVDFTNENLFSSIYIMIYEIRDNLPRRKFHITVRRKDKLISEVIQYKNG